jgi:hypothetical protein
MVTDPKSSTSDNSVLDALVDAHIDGTGTHMASTGNDNVELDRIVEEHFGLENVPGTRIKEHAAQERRGVVTPAAVAKKAGGLPQL